MKSKLFTSFLSVCVALMVISGSSVNAKMLKNNSFVEKKGITIEYWFQTALPLIFIKEFKLTYFLFNLNRIKGG